MGISGLLPLLKSIHKHTTLKKFAGQTLGIDGYGWLHRGSIACAIDLALDKPTTKYIEFAVNRVRMLLDFGITPYVVFDGDALPSKAGTNQERREKRHEAKTLGLSLYRAGKMSQAYQELQKATSVTPQMARLLINELRKMNVQYIVAPYEADAQLAYLEQQGIINGILSEDSDLLVFGAKRLITKLDQYGECVEIERKDFPLVKEISLNGWTDDMFRRMAILSGCDYLPNIEKMGLKTAYRFVRKYKDPERLIKMIAFEGKFCVPAGYLQSFQNAELTFLHHRVFCPIQQKMVFLNELDRGQDSGNMPFLGEHVDPEIAIGVACGDLNPKTKLPLEVRAQDVVRPSLKDNRRQTLGTPTELKHSKSIETFFKPNRTPLQELDPNSLTPSLSQQRLLERNRNMTWDAHFANSAPQLQRALTASFGTPNTKNTDRRSFLARASTLSNYKSPKRQRLCSEVDVSPSKEVKQSPFFTSAVSSASPLDQKRKRNRKAKSDFDVWSDDSVDDILLGLSDVQQVASPQNVKTSAGWSSKAEISRASDEVEIVLQSSPLKQANFDDRSEVAEYTDGANISYEDVDSRIEEIPEPQDLLQHDSCGSDKSSATHPTRGSPKSDRTFSAQSVETQRSALKSLLEQTPPKEHGQKRLLAEEPSSKKDSTPREETFAPPTLLNTFIYQSPEKQIAALETLQGQQTNAEKIRLGRAAVRDQRLRDSLVHTPAALGDPGSTIHPGGSEDALVPNSEDEISECEEGTNRPVLNLRGFIFRS